MEWNITNHVTNSTTITSQLVIFNLQITNHSGTYICEVHNNNRQSSVKQNVMVIVESKSTVLSWC